MPIVRPEHFSGCTVEPRISTLPGLGVLNSAVPEYPGVTINRDKQGSNVHTRRDMCTVLTDVVSRAGLWSVPCEDGAGDPVLPLLKPPYLCP